MEAQKTNWPVLDRAAFLIEHASVPKYVPRYCAEAAQLMSMLAESLQQQNQSGGCDGGEK